MLILSITQKAYVQEYKNQLESMFHIVQQVYLPGREMIQVYIESIASLRKELYGSLRNYPMENNIHSTHYFKHNS
jgi:hypothetical protein